MRVVLSQLNSYTEKTTPQYGHFSTVILFLKRFQSTVTENKQMFLKLGLT